MKINETSALQRSMMQINRRNSGIMAILTERLEQINKHYRTIEDDWLHNPSGQLIEGARALLKPNTVDHDFPDNWGVAACRKMINKPYKERLIIAGALIAAEIDRINYGIEKLKKDTDEYQEYLKLKAKFE